jgi:hypothetical protein
MTPSQVKTRRWQRHQVDLPVDIVFLNGMSKMMVPGRGIEISEGGMAFYAGIEVQPGDLMEVEFKTPGYARVAGIVRDRACFCFGLEFLTPLQTDNDRISVSRLAAFALEQGRLAETELLAPVGTSGFDKIRAAENAAAAYVMLGRLLREQGKPAATRTADRAAALFLWMKDIYLRQKELETKRLRRQMEAVRRVAFLLLEVDQRAETEPKPPSVLARPVREWPRAMSG